MCLHNTTHTHTRMCSSIGEDHHAFQKFLVTRAFKEMWGPLRKVRYRTVASYCQQQPCWKPRACLAPVSHLASGYRLLYSSRARELNTRAGWGKAVMRRL